MKIQHFIITSLLLIGIHGTIDAESTSWSYSTEIAGSGGRGHLDLKELTDSTCAISWFTFETDIPEGSEGSFLSCEFDLEDFCEVDGHRIVSVATDAVECGDYHHDLYLRLPKTIRRIEDRAFRGDGAHIYTPDSLDYLGREVFWQNSGVKDCQCRMSMPKSLKKISDRTFYYGGWDGNLPVDVEYIGNSAFRGNVVYGWSGEIVFPESLTHIGYGAFESCKEIKSIIFPSKLQYLGQNSFQSCVNLTNVKLPSSLEVLHDCFNGCTLLTTLKLSEGLKEIDAFALQNLHLELLSIPSTVESIGVSALPTTLQSLFISDNSAPLETEFYLMEGGSSDFSSFESPLEYLYIGRNIQPLNGCQAYFEQVTTLKNVVIADGVMNPSLKFYVNPSLETIELHTMTPPEVDYYDHVNKRYRNFTEEQYKKVLVTIPQGAMTNYLLNPVWKNFLNIRESEYSAIEPIKAESSTGNVEIYDLSGHRLSGNSLSSGLYIVRQNNTTIKRVIK